jgi:hypothetical protein
MLYWFIFIQAPRRESRDVKSSLNSRTVQNLRQGACPAALEAAREKQGISPINTLKGRRTPRRQRKHPAQRVTGM